ncbi:MAG: PP2C family serine/threonine-protein phosphatase [Pseudomonadota bacterium]
MIALYAHASGAIIGARDTQEDSHLCTVVERVVTQPSAPGAIEATVSELLVVVCDGMGGHAAGEIASAVAARTFAETYERLVVAGAGAPSDKTRPLTPGSQGAPGSGSPVPVTFEPAEGARPLRADDPLLGALLAANQAIQQSAARKAERRGMGCTLVAATFTATGVRWISVGDSLIFRHQKSGMERLNEDHSMAPILDDLAHRGLMDRYEAQSSPRRHQLRAALTGGALDLVDLRDNELPLREGDWILMATDGLESLSERNISDLVRQHGQEGADRLVDALLVNTERVNDPTQDNTTIVAIQARSGDGDVGQTVRTAPVTRTQPLGAHFAGSSS